ncbi:MAG: hypothetical protein HY769_02510 [Candidatus Stahlbacteria bacterium]|nr:hypothetical protein [Candidatus Stahlbacteria bacterium]
MGCYVIMPEHLHLLVWWDINENKDLTILKIMHGIKGHSAVRIRDYIKNTGRLKPLLQPDESRGSHLPHKCGLRHKIWQSGFYDFNILSCDKLNEKINYIHNNLFKDKRITSPEDYPYSSKLFYDTGTAVFINGYFIRIKIMVKNA